MEVNKKETRQENQHRKHSTDEGLSFQKNNHKIWVLPLEPQKNKEIKV